MADTTTSRRRRRGAGKAYPHQVVTVTDTPTHRRLEAHLENVDQSMSHVMREALIEYLDKRKVKDPGTCPIDCKTCQEAAAAA